MNTCPHPGPSLIHLDRQLIALELAEVAVCAKCRTVAFVRIAGTREKERGNSRRVHWLTAGRP
jgi:hypothetical protein